MPLTNYTHDEPGEHWIVVTPNPEFAEKRLGLQFRDGEVRTRDIVRAQEFAEVYDYEVIPWPGAPMWEKVESETVTGARPEWVDEPAVRLVSEEAPLNRPEGQLKPRKVKDEMAEDAAFSKAVPRA